MELQGFRRSVSLQAFVDIAIFDDYVGCLNQDAYCLAFAPFQGTCLEDLDKDDYTPETLNKELRFLENLTTTGFQVCLPSICFKGVYRCKCLSACITWMQRRLWEKMGLMANLKVACA